MKTLVNAGTGATDYSWVKDGMECWASAYEYTSSKEGLRCVQKPVQGIAHRAPRLPSDDPADAPHGMLAPMYFTPYKSGSRKLSSRTVGIRSRDISSTEAEARESYDARVKALIVWHEKRVQDLSDALLDP